MVTFRLDSISRHIVVLISMSHYSTPEVFHMSDQSVFLNVTSDEAWGVTGGILRFLDVKPYRKGGSI